MAITASGKLVIKKVGGLSFPATAELGSIAATEDNYIFTADLNSAQSGRNVQFFVVPDSGVGGVVTQSITAGTTTVPQGVAIQDVDGARPVVWLTDYATTKLYWFDMQSNASGEVNLGTSALEAKSRGLAYGKLGSDQLVVVAQEGTGHGNIFVINASTKATLSDRTQAAPADGAPTNVVLDTISSRAFVGDYSQSRIYYFDPTKPAASNKISSLELQGSAKEGTVYGLAVNQKLKCVWALDSQNSKLYRIGSIDTIPIVDPKVVDITSGKYKLTGFWDLAIDSEGYLWMPCTDGGGVPSVLQLNPNGNFVGLYPVVEDTLTLHSPPATYLDTLVVGPLSPSQSHDVISVVNRSPAGIFEIRPGTVANEHGKGPTPDPRVLSKDIKFIITPLVLKATANGDFPEFKISVVDGAHSNTPITDCMVEIRVVDSNTRAKLKIVPGKGGDCSTEIYASFITSSTDGVAIVPSGVLHAGNQIDKNLKIEVTTRGALVQQVPCEIFSQFVLEDEPDHEEWARRTTGTFELNVGTNPVESNVDVTLMLNDDDYNDGARFLDPISNKPKDSKTITVKTHSVTGIAKVSLRAGSKLKTYTIKATCPDAKNLQVNLKPKHVKPQPTKVSVNFQVAHARQFAKATVTVMGLADDGATEINIPYEPLDFILTNLRITAPVTRDRNARCSFLQQNQLPANIKNPKFWPGSPDDGQHCHLDTDAAGIIIFGVPTATTPGMRAFPEGDTMQLNISLTNPSNPIVVIMPNAVEIRH